MYQTLKIIIKFKNNIRNIQLIIDNKYNCDFLHLQMNYSLLYNNKKFIDIFLNKNPLNENIKEKIYENI